MSTAARSSYKVTFDNLTIVSLETIMSDDFTNDNVMLDKNTTLNIDVTTAVPLYSPWYMTIFQAVLLLIGTIGLLSNLVILLALIWSKDSRRQTTNSLIINQLTIDIFANFFVVVSHSILLANVTLTSSLGSLVVCCLLQSDMVTFTGQMASVASLLMIALERYIMIVHPVLHRKYFKRWMIYVAVCICWLNGILMNISVFWTTEIIDGVCLPFWFWPNNTVQMASSIFTLIWEYVLPIFLFIYFYGHILLVIRRSNKVFQVQMLSTGNENSEHQATLKQSHVMSHSEVNVIKTMIIVTVAFAVCWAPNQFYFMIYVALNNSVGTAIYMTLVIAFSNACLNPFIYAAKHEAVKKQLKVWFGVDKIAVSGDCDLHAPHNLTKR